MAKTIEKEIEILFKIERKPGFYLGRESISLMMAFFRGYLLGITNDKPKPIESIAGFQEYIAKRHSIKTSHSWADIILFMEGNDERRAFRSFYAYFYEFLKDKGYEIPCESSEDTA
ncbi:hypothetical protein [Acanthopleuribacter pedis]|uniref:Uncharacterized protein n=1 Tax=Acanthopleuribacter pedis TaxID=442870 RepID=A0A8J7Q9P7_9BACT|nr:hypothetical protein [Acanthopleuribacter pedis]MBO1319549.1 hypothetical protein [Acanthopleuribacter pedis]